MIFSLNVKAVKWVCEETWMHLKFAAQDDDLISRSLKGSALSTIALKDIHRIEKGLSLHYAKRPFGADLVKRIKIFTDYARKSPSDHLLSVRATKALALLGKWNREGDRSIGELTTLASPYSGTMNEAAWASFFK